MSNRQQVEETEKRQRVCEVGMSGGWAGAFYLHVFLCQLRNESNRTQSISLSLLCFFWFGYEKNDRHFSPLSLIASLSVFSHFVFPSLCPLGKPVMIVTEYMENGSLDTFLKVSIFYFTVDDEGQLAPKEML